MITQGGRKAIVAIAVALSVSATTRAQGRTDVVTSPTAIGSPARSFDSSGVASNSSPTTRLVEVLTTDGRRFLGSLGTAAARSITVVTSESESCQSGLCEIPVDG